MTADSHEPRAADKLIADKLIAALRESGREAEAARVQELRPCRVCANDAAAGVGDHYRHLTEGHDDRSLKPGVAAYRNLRGETVADGDAWTP